MLKRCSLFPARAGAAAGLERARALLDQGAPKKALDVLDEVKAELAKAGQPRGSSGGDVTSVELVDYTRALAFLQLGSADGVLQARQALFEELRRNPDNEEARKLAARVEWQCREMLKLPDAVAEAEKEFAMLHAALSRHTMLSWTRLFSLYVLAKRVCEDRVPGCIVECGTAGGGSAVLMGAVCNFLGSPRHVYACDTFSGMPPPTDEDVLPDGTHATASHWGHGTCSSSERAVQDLAGNFGLQFTTVAGVFEDTLPTLAPVVASDPHPIALLHLDADWYSSTQTALKHLGHRVQPNGCVQCDDYGYWSGCRQAVDEYFAAKSWPTAALQEVDGNAVWFSPRNVTSK